jgi:hypothetical protein
LVVVALWALALLAAGVAIALAALGPIALLAGRLR